MGGKTDSNAQLDQVSNTLDILITTLKLGNLQKQFGLAYMHIHHDLSTMIAGLSARIRFPYSSGYFSIDIECHR